MTARRALLLVLAAATLACAGRAVSPSSATTGGARTITFVSKEYAYSLSLPGRRARWALAPAYARWTGGSLEPNVPQFDTIDDLADGRFFILGSLARPHSTLAAWTRYFLSSHALACRRTSPISRSRLDGAAARSYTFKCSDAYGIGIDAIHGGRGYFMVLSIHGAGNVGSAHRREFEAARRSFRFAQP